MENKKTKPVANKKKTGLMKDSTKTRLIVGAILAFFVISTVGYFTFALGLPAKFLSGGTVAGQDVKVTEMNYRFYEVFNMYRQYGMVSSEEDLDKVFNEETGETYRAFIMNQAAQSLQRTKILAQEATKSGFVAEAVDKRIDQYVESLRTYAQESNTTADKILSSQFGKGISLRDVKDYLQEEYYAEEYAEYMKQTSFNMTTDEMQAMYDANPTAYEKVTYNAYLFASKVPSTETDTALVTAGKDAAKKLAEDVIAKANDPASFLAACKEIDGANNEAAFADGKDPTIYLASDKTYTDALSTEFTTFMFDAARVANDTAVIETPAGYYAVLYQSRGIDSDPTVSYRVLTITGTDLAAVKTEVEGYKAQVTDEASFISLVKKNSDETTAYAGGYYSGVTQDTIDSASATTFEKDLYAWLFAAERKAGDLTIINNIDSVSLVYFTKSMPEWMSTLNGNNVNVEFEAWYNALAADPARGFTINMANIEFASK